MTDTPDMGNRTAPFVRSQMLGEQPPPASTVGIVGWLRANFFSGPVNSATTVVILAVIAYILPGIVHWAFVDAVWNAKSLSECRELGEGACWAVIVERFDQFVYGFYPSEERWRPNLAFILMLVAFTFALFDEMPGVSVETWAKIRPAGLVFSAVYPVIAYYLIWGGSFWPVVAVLAAGALGWLTLKRAGALVADEPLIPVGIKIVAAAFAAFYIIDLMMTLGGGGILAYMMAAVPVVAFIIFAANTWQTRDDQADHTSGALGALVIALALFAFSFVPIDALFTFGLPEVESRNLGGFLLSMIIGVAGIVLSLPIGIALALGRRSGLFFIQSVCIIFIEFIRGVPLITLLFVASSVISYLFPPDTALDLVLRVVIMVTAFASAYMAEVIRGGLASLPPGQYEAADAMGLNYWQATRLIIMPQALKVSIPNIVNTFIGLFKDTTLVVVIGLLDPIGLITTTRADSAWNGIIWEFYVFVGLFFFIACFAMSRYSMYLERKLATDRR